MNNDLALQPSFEAYTYLRFPPIGYLARIQLQGKLQAKVAMVVTNPQ